MQRKERGGRKERGKWKVSGVSQRQLETRTEQEKVPLAGLKEDACPVFIPRWPYAFSSPVKKDPKEHPL